MLDVALGAVADIGMERGRLSLQESGVVGMASDTLAVLRALHGRVTSGARVFQKCMGSSEQAWTGHALPGRWVQHPRTGTPGMTLHVVKGRKQAHE